MPSGLPDVSNSIGLRLFPHDSSKNYARKWATNLLNVGPVEVYLGKSSGETAVRP